MDFATIIGLVLAWGALAGCLLLEGGDATGLLNIPALVLVVFGTWGAALAGTNLKTARSLPSALKSALSPESLDAGKAIDAMTRYARIARRQGVLGLENASARIDNQFMRKGIELVVDGTPSVIVRDVLETEIAAMRERHKAGEAVFTSLGGFSPTLGIIGTVLGLINMLSKLNEPSKMGHAIAAAFVATFYGVVLANLLYLPMAAKLRSRTANEAMVYEMIIEGVLAIQSGENPRAVESRMLAFLPPKMRLGRKKPADYREDSMAA
jgi:chemotaxis protein MotA